ncbi:MAG: hypothetical protein FJX72_16840, partial [Armatimonadetes bacterium]|nr:hypothetical protein [Armatimonadota bacterium]
MTPSLRTTRRCTPAAQARRNRVPEGAFEWLEPDDGKLSSPVLRGGCGGNAAPLLSPDGLRRSAHHGGAANPVSFVWDGDDLLNEYRSGGVSCRYDVLDGEVFGERRDGSRCLYVPDPLGSINHLLGTGQTIAGTYVYFPYGEVQSHTGPDTPMQFVGGLGYYTGVVSREYVRARCCRPDVGRWQTVAP